MELHYLQNDLDGLYKNCLDSFMIYGIYLRKKYYFIEDAQNETKLRIKSLYNPKQEV
jgi:hypothetical protein